MTAVRDFGLLWDAQAYGNGATINSDAITVSPGRSSLTLLVWSTRAGNLTLQCTLSSTITNKGLN